MLTVPLGTPAHVASLAKLKPCEVAALQFPAALFANNVPRRFTVAD